MSYYLDLMYNIEFVNLLIYNNKRRYFMKNFFKNQRGSVSLYALVAMLLLLTILLGIYVYNSQKQAQNLEITKQIKSVYEKDVNNIDNVYNNLIA